MFMSGKLRMRQRLRLSTSRRWRIGLAALLPVAALLVRRGHGGPGQRRHLGLRPNCQ
jgi:hypothetical protein